MAAKPVKKKLGKAAASQPARKPNPFELKTAKTKFDTIGRRTKGATKNVVKARQEAITKVRCAASACTEESSLLTRLCCCLHTRWHTRDTGCLCLHLHTHLVVAAAAQEDAAGRVQGSAQGQHLRGPALWG